MPRPNRGRQLWCDQRTGIWHIRWFEAGEHRTRSTGQRDRGKAEETLARVEHELALPALPASPTIGDVLSAWVEASRSKHAWISIRSHARAVTGHLGWLPVSELRQAHIRTYVAQVGSEGRGKGTIREDLSKLRAAIRWGAREGLCEHRDFSIPVSGAPRERWLTRDECDRLVASARVPHVRLFILLCLHTAGRTSAILELEWSRVDFVRNIIDLGRKPGGKPRATVPMTRTIRAELETAMAIATTQWVIEYGGHRVVDGKWGWQTARAAAGLPDVTRHDLRRTAGSLMLQEGVPLERVAAFLGHLSVRTTERVYAHLAVEHLRDAARALDR